MERRLQTERSLQPQRDKIVAVQLKEQAARINVEQFDQKLLEAGADIVALNNMLPDNARVSTFQTEIGRLNAEIDGLGPVNLGAAIELNEASNRKKYLEEQFQDLTDAIATLEDAIRRIDRETRSLLKNTFDEVNQSLNELFPVLFGGGHAQLSMTGRRNSRCRNPDYGSATGQKKCDNSPALGWRKSPDRDSIGFFLVQAESGSVLPA